MGEPADRTLPIIGPHRGPTSHYRGYAAGSPADSAVLSPAKAPGHAYPYLHDIGMKFDPHGVGIVWGFLSAGALRLPAVINSATPMGSAAARHAP